MLEQMITQEHLNGAYSYKSFKELVFKKYQEGKPTSGEHSEEYPLLDFTRENLDRIDRLDREIPVDPGLAKTLKDISQQRHWLVLAEGWCGDVSQNLPVLAKIASVTDKIDLKILLRDQNPEVMDAFLTNGGRSIPKLIALDAATLKVLYTWGPRPAVLQEKIMQYKQRNEHKVSHHKLVEKIHDMMHRWYDEDKGQILQEEFQHLIREKEEVS